MANVYPIWWSNTITIFNKYENPQTQLIKWYKTIVNGAYWKNIGNKIMIDDVTLETNNIICRIRKDDRFLEKYEWVKKPNDEMANYFTLGKGDIIVKGEVDDIIDEYTSGKRATDIIAKYKDLQGCMEIDKVTIDSGIGLGNEHYYVKGV